VEPVATGFSSKTTCPFPLRWRRQALLDQEHSTKTILALGFFRLDFLSRFCRRESTEEVRFGKDRDNPGSGTISLRGNFFPVSGDKVDFDYSSVPFLGDRLILTLFSRCTGVKIRHGTGFLCDER